MRPSSAWLAPVAALFLIACYAELPGSADVDSLDGGGLGGIGATTAGGSAGGTLGGGIPGGSLSDAGSSSDGGTSEAGQVANCDGVGVGTTQQRIRYAAVQVVSPDTCKSEVQSRTCTATGFSAWSGAGYAAESCSVGTLRSCGATASGQSETRQRYPVEVTADASDCEAETQMRVCTDGTWGAWSGTATFEACRVSFLGTCGVSGLFTANMCDANTTCKVKGIAWPRCLGNAGHACTANGDCVVTCVNSACTGSDPARGGACDDAADCANTLCPNVSGTGSVAAGCAANVCACPNNSLCTANNQCTGTCVAQSALLSMCVTANTTCDKDDDCRADSKCVKSGSGVSGTCLLPDGKGPCTADAQCEHICRAGTCGQPGANGESCAENADCKGNLVCRTVALSGTQCAMPGGIGEFCDEAADCGGNTTCAASTVGGAMMCLGATGASCTTAAAAYQCASGVCIPCTMGPECTGSIGTCQ